jgi:hypothetical protein
MNCKVDYRDIIGGGLLVIVGLSAGIYASVSYNPGTVTRMGPGMLPAALGYILASLGVVVVAGALFRSGDLPKPEYRPLVAVLAGTLLFALTINVLGMIPSIFLLTIAAVLADDKLGIKGTLILAAVLSVLAVLIFRVGLNISLYPFIWPF